VNNTKRQFATISALMIVMLFATNTYLRISNPPNNNLSWDTFGYYLYLPASFIYNDLGLENKAVFDDLIEKYHSTGTFYQISKGPKGYWMMKYSAGMAVLYAPGFFVGHLVALNSDFPADGFSLPYQWALIGNGLLVFLIGLLFLRKVLLRFFPDKIVAIILLLIYFGTNYFSYSTFNAEMPHTYLFTAYAAVLWFTIRWHETHKAKDMAFLAITIGLSTLARPTELIAILIPIFWNVDSFPNFKKKLSDTWQTYKPQLFLFATIMLAIGSVQVIYWKIYSGSFIYYSYINPGEGFEFLWPYTLRFLFSFRKGWLIYTPLMVFALWGLYLLYRKNKEVFVPIVIFFIVNLYIVSSWSCWWYAQSFGARAMVQSYAIMSIPLGYAIQRITGLTIIKRIILGAIIAFMVALNLFQYWQMQRNILSSDRMTFDYYLKAFGKTKVQPEDKSLLLIDRFNMREEVIPLDSNLRSRVIKHIDFESITGDFSKHLSDSLSRSGKFALKMDSSLNFSPTFKTAFNELTDNYYAWIRVSVWVYPVHNLNSTPVSLVISFQHKGKSYKYRGLDFTKEVVKNKLIPNQWNKISMDYLTPEVRSANDNLVTYIWNRGENEIYFDDFTVEVFEEKPAKPTTK